MLTATRFQIGWFKQKAFVINSKFILFLFFFVICRDGGWLEKRMTVYSCPFGPNYKTPVVEYYFDLTYSSGPGDLEAGGCSLHLPIFTPLTFVYSTTINGIVYANTDTIIMNITYPTVSVIPIQNAKLKAISEHIQKKAYDIRGRLVKTTKYSGIIISNGIKQFINKIR